MTREEARAYIIRHCNPDYPKGKTEWETAINMAIKALEGKDNVPDTNVGDINKFIDGLEEIFADIRERHGDDTVCGLCEYDGAYIGQSGDWCNECPGFDKDGCKTCIHDKETWWSDACDPCCGENYEAAQPEIICCKDCYFWEKQQDSLQGRCARYGTYPTGYWYCASARERREDEL